MKYLLASTLAALIAAASAAALAQTPSNNAAAGQPCDIAYVTGVGGSPETVREYLATPSRDQYRFLKENDIQCKVSDEGRASGCIGITSLRHEKVSVYDDSDRTTTTVIARVELEHGTYPVMIVVPKQDMQCAQ